MSMYFKLLIILIILSCYLPHVTSAYAQDDQAVFVQQGHVNDTIMKLCFSQDGEYILSAGSDNLVKIWYEPNGREFKTLTGRGWPLAFSTNGQYVFFKDQARDLTKLWDTETDREVVTFKGNNHPGAAAISPDNRTVLTSESDREGMILKLWDIATGRAVRVFNGHHTGGTYTIAFSQDAKHVLTGSRDKTVKLWDVASGNLIRTFYGHTDEVNSVVFSPDGTRALSSSSDKTLKLWDIISGKEIMTLKHDNWVNSAAFSPDGNYVLSGGNASTGVGETQLSLWDITTGKNIRVFSGASKGAFSPDGKYVVGGSNILRFWDIASGKEVKQYKGRSSSVVSFAVSPDSKYLLVGNKDKSINFWEVNKGHKFRTIKVVLDENFPSTIISPNGKHLLTGGYSSPELLDIETGKKVRTFKGNSSVTSLAFSPDGKYILTGDLFAGIHVYDATSGNQLKMLSKNEAGENPVDSIVFSPDGKYIFAMKGKKLSFFDAKKKQIIKNKSFLNLQNVTSAVFSQDGRHILISEAVDSVHRDNNITLYDISTGQKIRTFRNQTNWVNALAISRNGKFALSADYVNNTINYWDVSTGNEIRTLKGHTGLINSIFFSSNDASAFSSSNDGTVRIWNLATGKETVKLVSLMDGEWITITPEGYYNSSPNGHQNLNVRQEMKVYGIDQFYDVFYRPDIVLAKLRGDDITPLISITIDDVVKSPPPTVKFTKTPSDTASSKTQVCYQATSTGGGIGEVRLFQNGKLIKSDGFYRENIAKASTEKRQLVAMNSRAIQDEMRGLVVKEKENPTFIVSKPKGETFEECVDLETVPGENEISVTAFNAGNTVQSYMQNTSFNSTRTPDEPHLYILSVGIDKYSDDRVNLKYAAKDASDFIAKLPEKARNQYKSANIHLETILDTQASRAGILNKIDELSGKIKPGDSFILFVASHGVLVQDQYYIVTADYDGNLYDTKKLISSNEIVDMSKKIKSLSQLFIFDTCHAGGVDNIISGLYDARMSVMAKKMGLHIYASAGSVQTAMDGYKGNGLYTHTLLQGVANGKDVDKEKSGKVTVKSLGTYSKEMTTEISTKLGHPQTPFIINFGRDNPLFAVQ